MSVPKKIIVSPFVVTTEDNASVLGALGGDAAILPEEGRLLYDGNQDGFYLRDSVLHEVIHLAYRQTPLNDTSDTGREREERIVSALAPRLLGVIRDNKALMTWLQGAE